MALLRVSDLKAHLKRTGLSPRAFARVAQVSHMTIHRWLQKGPNAVIPEKYYALLAPAIGRSTLRPEVLAKGTLEEMMAGVEAAGEAFSGDARELVRSVRAKISREHLPRVFSALTEKLISACAPARARAGRPGRRRSLAVGALLYFVDPVGLIPDSTPVIGYLDDLAILAVALHELA